MTQTIETQQNLHLNTTSNTQGMSKYFVEALIALPAMVLFLIVLPVMYLRLLFTGKAIFTPFNYTNNIRLSLFNTRKNIYRFLPLSLAILQHKVNLVGTAPNTENQTNPMQGLISLYGLRTLTGIDHESVEKTNSEYLQKRSISYDIKLLLRFILASVFSNKRFAYKNRLELVGVKFLNTTIEHTVAFLDRSIKEKKKSRFYFVNADTLNKAYEKPAFRRLLNDTPFVLPDGSGVKMACNMMFTPLKQNLNGTDLFPFICEMAAKEGHKIFLYGAKEGVAEKVKNNMVERFPDLQVVGAVNGYDYHDNEVINMINHSGADMVFIAKGAPLQEEWINTYRDKISAPIMMGVGGLFDFYSGEMPRAPKWIREIGMEWIYRLIQEPKRMWKRYVLGNPRFLLRVYLWHREQNKIRLNAYYQTMKSAKWSPSVDMNRVSSRFYPTGKRILDIVVSSLAIIAFSPILITTAILIKLESRGSLIFKQQRIGKDGKVFSMYKFRSMVQNAEALKEKLSQTNESEDGVIFKMKDDPRITKVGKFIRTWSIDELPQLFNVLNGTMSLVGPRPSLASEVSEYVTDDLKRLHVVPGITCYWQIAGRSEIPFKQQVDLDKKYIANRSLWTDIKILFGTVPAVLLQKGLIKPLSFPLQRTPFSQI